MELTEWHPPAGESDTCIKLGDAQAYGVPVILDQRNTFLRVFGEGYDSPYNQVVHFLPGFETPLLMPLNHENMEPYKQRLLNEGYPIYRAEHPDRHVRAWLTQVLNMQRRQETET